MIQAALEAILITEPLGGEALKRRTPHGKIFFGKCTVIFRVKCILDSIVFVDTFVSESWFFLRKLLIV